MPLRLYVDQDAVDFLKKFFSFKNPDVDLGATPSQGDTYIRELLSFYLYLAFIFGVRNG